MPIPTAADHALTEIDNLHAVVLVRLRSLHFTAGYDPRRVVDALKEYCDRVEAFINADHR
jgi:hypothetical protein